VAAWAKLLVCGRSIAGIVGSNPAGGVDVSCNCCVLSGRGPCVGVTNRPEESYRLWCVVVCDRVVLIMRPWPTRGCCSRGRGLIPSSKWPSCRNSGVDKTFLCGDG
jgi:hypothetical protein